MRFNLKFKATNNYGLEAPGGIRTFCLPPLAAGYTKEFTWMVDSNKIVWISWPDSDVLDSPCLHFCLDAIRARDPGSLSKVLLLISGDK